MPFGEGPYLIRTLPAIEKAELDQEPDAADQGDESDQDEPRRAIAIVTAPAVDADPRDPQRQDIKADQNPEQSWRPCYRIK